MKIMRVEIPATIVIDYEVDDTTTKAEVYNMAKEETFGTLHPSARKYANSDIGRIFVTPTFFGGTKIFQLREGSLESIA